MAELSGEQWEDFISAFPDVHILQTRVWGDLKSRFGWEPVRVFNARAGAQVLFKVLPLGLRIAYLPKGPVGTECEGLWEEIDQICRRKNAIMLKVEPDDDENGKYSGSRPYGFVESGSSVQPRRTIVLDLEGSEDEWLSRMKPKTRYNIRLAEKKGIVVNSWNDIDKFHQLMVATGDRDGFGVHSKEYYQAAHDLFAARGACELLVAEYDRVPLAALMVFAWGSRSWYLYGASTNIERNRMPTYLLQWRAMQWAAQKGCKAYDLWGVPDFSEEILEKQFEKHSDGLWGVYRFKRGFGGTVIRSAATWERVYRPVIHQIYRIYDHLKHNDG
jgi:peptidoglycan pentaglycine glycine transferase (the first glycine)